MEIQLPYIRFDETNELDPRYIKPYNIAASDESKRIRVFCNQLLDDIVEETTLSNFYFNIGVFGKLRNRLLKKFPHRRKKLESCGMEFWSKMQTKYKQLKKEENNK